MLPGSSGRLFGVGVGPGDPELMTLKAARVLAQAPVVAWFAKAGRAGHARTIAERHIAPAAEQLPLTYPFTTEQEVGADYRSGMAAFYDESAAALAARLDAGSDVAVLCEGDPFLYGSFMYLHDRLAGRFETEVVAGVTAMSGCWSRAGLAMTRGDDSLAVLSATLPEERLAERLRDAEAVVVMKLGRHLAKVRRALGAAGLLQRAVYVEKGAMAGERILPLAEKRDDEAPYFSLVLVPSLRRQV
jgi:precorrin-2/cobalt-factor-2 C20-methyltransferase